MKQPVVNYRNFRFSKLNDPQFSHLKLLFGWVIYFLFYFLTERLIPPEQCHPVYCPIDDWIPFMEIFLIPYIFWYGLIVFSLIYFLLYSIPSFCNLSKYIIITQVIAIFVYIILPSRQDLRPQVFPRDNILTHGIAILYAIDTNTGVCPSLHVAYSIAIASVWLKEKSISTFWKSAVLVSVVLICLSTVFIKQHSVIDFFAALPVCALAEFLVFKTPASSD